MDLHANQIQGFFDIPVDNLLGSPLFVNEFFRKYAAIQDETMVVSPDVGSVARARALRPEAGYAAGHRGQAPSEGNSSEVMNIIGDVRDKHVILLDDMVDTAAPCATPPRPWWTSARPRASPPAPPTACSPGPAVQRISDSVLDEVVFLDTIPPKPGVKCDKIRYISVAHLFAEAISHIYEETSVSRLFS